MPSTTSVNPAASIAEPTAITLRSTQTMLSAAVPAARLAWPDDADRCTPRRHLHRAARRSRRCGRRAVAVVALGVPPPHRRPWRPGGGDDGALRRGRDRLLAPVPP